MSLHSLKDIITLKPENPNFNHVARILAVSHSSFTEVLYINEDSLLLQYPAGLFASEAFSETGAVFWKSPFKTRPDNPIWKLLGLRCVDEYEAEYGMFLINKAFNGVTTALDLAIKVLENEIVYDYVPDGGGTLIKFCLRMVGNPFHIYPQESAMLYSSYNGIECGEEKGVFYDGKILFIGSLNGKRSKKSNPLLIVRICLMVEKGTAFGQP